MIYKREHNNYVLFLFCCDDEENIQVKIGDGKKEDVIWNRYLYLGISV